MTRAGQGRGDGLGGAARPAETAGGGSSARADILALDHPDWLLHHLDVTGPAEDLTLFRLAAAGPGVIPWTHGRAGEEEDLFHLLAAPPRGERIFSLHGCRVVAGGIRTALERADERVRAAASRPGGPVPLDLHRLVPVPPDVLRLGPSHPEALGWLWANWGTTWPLRHVAHRSEATRGRGKRGSGAGTGRGGDANPARLSLAFWSADWTPWAALVRVRQAWPSLSLDLRPRYDDG
ncbi:hypothetical protein ACE7GA_00180 [Roseomonas sp. CCTCC AB2023176]|uniref:hypothetical protein n=1 Tax=Roseomonas sp. CCTCC AB2023176 TaxID=3342640 RepID=UPI0035DC47E6